MKPFTIFSLLILASLACTINGELASLPPTATSAPTLRASSTPARTVTPTLSPTPVSTTLASAPACHVSTGILEGRLYLRACGSMACPVLKTLAEGEPIVIIQPGQDWSQVRAGSMTGWAATKYLECAP